MPGSGPINAKLSQPTFEVGFAQAVLLSGMIVKVYTPKIVARDCYGSAVVVDGVAAAVVAVRVVAAVVSLFSGRGRRAVATLTIRVRAAPPFEGVHRSGQACDRRIQYR